MSALRRLGIKSETTSINSIDKTSITQKQTEEAFGFKWAKRNTYESEAVKENAKAWLLERYCDNDPSQIQRWLEGGRKIILDAGCGAGLTGLLMFGEFMQMHDYLGIDISSATEIARNRYMEAGCPADFLQRNLLDLEDIPDGSIDIIYSEGVLHHTDNTEEAVKYLARKICRGGRFLFYVYAKKAVIREFTDDHIRKQLQSFSDEEAWQSLESLTELGIALGKLNVDIDVPEDIPMLGIKRGKLDLQRFFYWNICKLYYRDDYNKDEMNHVNFDWFRPLNCHRHTPEEVRSWCADSNLEIEHMNVQDAGITIVAKKR